jgi:hypothetical protein
MDIVDLETELEELLSEVDNMPELSESEIYLIKVPLCKTIDAVSKIRQNAMRPGRLRVMEVTA